MKAYTIRHAGRTHGALERAGELDVLDVRDAIAALRGVGPSTGQVVALESASFAPVVPSPGKIICVGRNYRAHVSELGRELPEHPTLFAKFGSTLIGARDEILMPDVSPQLDWEGELAVVISKRTKRTSPKEAADSILGYTIMNDVSVRDWQWRSSQWLQGKNFDRTAPLGPAIVTPEEVGHAEDLLISVEVDGRTVQSASTSKLIWKPAELVSYISQFCTLEPGDVIATGTPEGVGVASEPPVFLTEGQVLRTAIEGIGECRNVVAPS